MRCGLQRTIQRSKRNLQNAFVSSFLPSILLDLSFTHSFTHSFSFRSTAKTVAIPAPRAQETLSSAAQEIRCEHRSSRDPRGGCLFLRFRSRIPQRLMWIDSNLSFVPQQNPPSLLFHLKSSSRFSSCFVCRNNRKMESGMRNDWCAKEGGKQRPKYKRKKERRRERRKTSQLMEESGWLKVR